VAKDEVEGPKQVANKSFLRHLRADKFVSNTTMAIAVVAVDVFMFARLKVAWDHILQKITTRQPIRKSENCHKIQSLSCRKLMKLHS
jgi:hypothetical protein